MEWRTGEAAEVEEAVLKVLGKLKELADSYKDLLAKQALFSAAAEFRSFVRHPPVTRISKYIPVEHQRLLYFMQPVRLDSYVTSSRTKTAVLNTLMERMRKLRERHSQQVQVG